MTASSSNPTGRPVRRRAALVLAAALALPAPLAGCASYQPLPLSTGSQLHNTVADLDPAGSDTSGALDIETVVRLALANNPDLRAARAQQGVAEGQLLQAGLLPNPSVTGAFMPVLAGPGTASAWSAGFSTDLRALITLSSHRDAAVAAARQISASILWQEWQTAGKVRLLVIQRDGDRQMAAILNRAKVLLDRRYRLTRAAVAAGDADLTALAPDLAALGDVEKQIDDLDRQSQTRQHDLNALLGLRPGAAVVLRPVSEPPPVDAARVMADLGSLADRRPDLIALRLGYAAQDAKLRSAILSQFPALNVGLVGGSDSTSIKTFGPQITVDLPIFDRNQGNIAIERATRLQLREEFSARLAATESEVGRLLDDIALTARQLPPLRARTNEVRHIGAKAEAAFVAGNLSERAYVDFIAAQLARQQELLGLEQSLREQQVGLAALIGAGMPVVALPKDSE